jgi:hypothetical protein
MNDVLKVVTTLLSFLNKETKSQYVRISFDGKIIKFQFDWECNCHATYSLSNDVVELEYVTSDIVQFIIENMKKEHAKVHLGE